ncbi:hypothetical protein NQ314_015262 [Rhamnusium bicolor]|uniref:ZSWIM3 N-terminal domain-containing protein n=1 Tax=Rhamnusium bicolor TaxID=1586634 RepID=A0AAV8WZY0_9CUCU|nr:hypothetical protein NQ314_015262 [Rhamnusium bicolor]
MTSTHLEKRKTFVSLKELGDFIEIVENELFISLYKRDSKSLEHIKKYCLKKIRNANKDLVFYRIVFSCHKGGQKFKIRGTRVQKSSTFKEECPMKLIFTLSENRKNLVLSKMENRHNHNIVSNMHPLLPKQRELGQSENDEILK